MKTVLLKIVSDFDFKIILSSFAVFFTWVFNGKFEAAYIIFTLFIIDNFTGLWYAWRTKNINSRDFSRSPQKLLVYCIMLIVSRLVDKTLPVCAASTVMDTFIVCTEAVSILENLYKLGYPVPTYLVTRLKNFYDKKGVENGKED